MDFYFIISRKRSNYTSTKTCKHSFNMKSPKAILMLIDFFEKIKRLAFILIFIILHYFAFRNLYVLSEDMILGNFAAQKIVPIPIYGIERIPAGKKVAIKYHAQNRLGVDFAQIYFPAQQPNLLGNSYNENTTLDPAQRPSRYAPLVEYICAMTICKLDFGYASFWHMVIQILLFFLVSYLAFRSLGLKHLLLDLRSIRRLLYVSYTGRRNLVPIGTIFPLCSSRLSIIAVGIIEEKHRFDSPFSFIRFC